MNDVVRKHYRLVINPNTPLFKATNGYLQSIYIFAVKKVMN